MLIKRKSPFSGVINEMELPVTEAQLKMWVGGVSAQVAFPDLSQEEREFIMTGITPQEWEDVFGAEEED